MRSFTGHRTIFDDLRKMRSLLGVVRCDSDNGQEFVPADDPAAGIIFGGAVNAPSSAYTEIARAFAGATSFERSKIMSHKTVKTNKEAKKPAALSPKEKKMAKHAKKHASDAAPIIVR